jgi:hypothetical protein
MEGSFLSPFSPLLPCAVTIIAYLPAAVGPAGQLTVPCVLGHISQVLIDAALTGRMAKAVSCVGGGRNMHGICLFLLLVCVHTCEGGEVREILKMARLACWNLPRHPLHMRASPPPQEALIAAEEGSSDQPNAFLLAATTLHPTAD